MKFYLISAFLNIGLLLVPIFHTVSNAKEEKKNEEQVIVVELDEKQEIKEEETIVQETKKNESTGMAKLKKGQDENERVTQNKQEQNKSQNKTIEIQPKPVSIQQNIEEEKVIEPKQKVNQPIKKVSTSNTQTIKSVVSKNNNFIINNNTKSGKVTNSSNITSTNSQKTEKKSGGSIKGSDSGYSNQGDVNGKGAGLNKEEVEIVQKTEQKKQPEAPKTEKPKSDTKEEDNKPSIVKQPPKGKSCIIGVDYTVTGYRTKLTREKSAEEIRNGRTKKIKVIISAKIGSGRLTGISASGGDGDANARNLAIREMKKAKVSLKNPESIGCPVSNTFTFN